MKPIAFLLFFIGLASSQERKLNGGLNPGCGDTCKDKDIYLLHYTAVGPNDIIHHLWDVSKKPTVLVASTSLNGKLNVSWENFVQFEPNSLTFSEDIQYAFGVVIHEIITFAKNETYPTGSVPADEYSWKVDKYDTNVDHAFVTVKGTRNTLNNTMRTDNVTIVLRAYGKDGHWWDLPRLIHSTNVTEIEVILSNMEVPANQTSESRFGVKLGIISSDANYTKVEMVERSTLSDELSPGIFKVSEILTNPDKKKKTGGYLEWKQVAYTSSSKSIANSTDVYTTPVDMSSYEFANETVFNALFGDLLANLTVRTSSVYFGFQSDDPYTKHGYISWTFLSGIGYPLDDGISLSVLVIVTAILGLCLFLVVVTLCCLFFRRLFKNQEDFILSH